MGDCQPLHILEQPFEVVNEVINIITKSARKDKDDGATTKTTPSSEGRKDKDDGATTNTTPSSEEYKDDGTATNTTPSSEGKKSINSSDNNNIISSCSLCAGDNSNSDDENKAIVVNQSFPWIPVDDDNNNELQQKNREKREDNETKLAKISKIYINNTDTDDEISISSDTVPLMMTDDDALDEVSFTRELMGYEQGFEANEMPISRILEKAEEEEEDYNYGRREKEEKFIEQPRSFSTPTPTKKKAHQHSPTQKLSPFHKNLQDKTMTRQQPSRPPLPTTPKRYSRTDHNEKSGILPNEKAFSPNKIQISRSLSLERGPSYNSKSSLSSHSRDSPNSWRRKKKKKKNCEDQLGHSNGSFEEVFSRIFQRSKSNSSRDDEFPAKQKRRRRQQRASIAVQKVLDV